MRKTLELTGGLIFSQTVLLALVQKGAVREDAYTMVQRNAMHVWEKGKDFNKLLKADNEITAFIDEDEIDELFDLNKVMKNINKIFKRLGLIT